MGKENTREGRDWVGGAPMKDQQHGYGRGLGVSSAGLDSTISIPWYCPLTPHGRKSGRPRVVIWCTHRTPKGD